MATVSCSKAWTPNGAQLRCRSPLTASTSRAIPDRVAEPEGVLLVRSARYEEIDDYRRSTSPPRESSERDRGFESLYPSERLLAGRHCRLAEPGRPTGSSPRILCLEHLKRTCASAGRPRRKSRGRLRLERQYRD